VGSRGIPDRAFAQIFSKNIVQQGFAEAAKAQKQQAQETVEIETVTETPAYNYKPEIDRQVLPADIRGYMEFKDQHLDALVLVQTSDQRFYETFFEDAQQLGQALELILTSKESGIPEVGRVVAAGFPVKSLDKYLELLRQRLGSVASAPTEYGSGFGTLPGLPAAGAVCGPGIATYLVESRENPGGRYPVLRQNL
jgi:hypothetical protein